MLNRCGSGAGSLMKQVRFRVQLRLKSLKAIEGLAVDHGCMPRRKLDDGTLELTAIVTGGTLKKLQRKKSVQVEVLADADAEALESLKQVSRGNRYADGSTPVARGLERRKHVAQC